MKYRFRATRAFWRSFAKLSAQQQDRAREMFSIFKQNPFDSRLRSHKIQKLLARYRRIIYAAEIEANLRVVFYMEDNTVVTVDTARTICIADGYTAAVNARSPSTATSRLSGPCRSPQSLH